MMLVWRIADLVSTLLIIKNITKLRGIAVKEEK